MRIGISGYGRMGELIKSKAESAGHEIPVIIDPVSTSEAVTHRELSDDVSGIDVIIDFSVPSSAVQNIAAFARAGIPSVIGTTGWYDRLEEVERIVRESNAACIWSGNFSLGVNLFFRIAEAAGKLMDRFSQYDCMVHEYHHKNKADSPSGTAEMLGTILLKQLSSKRSIVTDALDRRIADDELHVSSTRGGSIPGTHRVTFDSDVDTVVLEHTARSRAGFAEGAVLAAEWIAGRTGLFHIDDMMKNIIEGD